MYKDLLVYFDEARASSGVQEAIVLARTFDAHLTGLYARPLLPVHTLPTYEALSLAEIAEAYEQDTRKAAEQVRADFESRCKLAGISFEWRMVDGEPGSTLNYHGRYADLILMAKAAGDCPPVLRAVPDAALFGSGRPLLVLPHGQGDYFLPPKRALIAWNASREAARAVHDAMPLLDASREVIVLGVGSESGRHELPCRDIALHLSRHGIRTEVSSIPAGAEGEGAALLVYAAAMGVDLIVMGGYGHSRLREFVLGGVTRHVRHNARVPVLMSH
jgi:nucleotide-binding universal stress UspA family protein